MSLFGTNLEHGQRYNRRVVLESVRLHGPLSRAEIARRTGLSAQTISNIMGQLKPADLILEHARQTGGRGQPPIDIEINPTGAVEAVEDWAMAAATHRESNDTETRNFFMV